MNRKVQVIRCLAIMAVVMIHTYGSGIRGVILRPFINYAVAAFLFVSGYLTDENKVITSYRKFCQKRITKVLIPYICWSVIYTIAYGTNQSILKKLITFSANGTMYYVFVYIQMVLVTPVLLRLLNSGWKNIGYGITLISMIVIRYIAPAWGWNLKFPFTAAFGGLWLAFYYFGLGLRNGKFKIKISLQKTVMLYSAALAVSIAEGMIWYHYGNYDLATSQLRLTSLLSSLLACILAYYYIEANRNTLTIVEHCAAVIGDCSFGIYLSHMLIIFVLGHIPGYSSVSFPLTSIIVLLISLLCVILGKRILGKKYAWYLGL